MDKNTITIATSLAIALVLYVAAYPVTGFLLVTGSLLFPEIPFLAVVFPFVLYFIVFFLLFKFIDLKRSYRSDDLTAPCKDCLVDTFETDEYYMVTDEIWNEIAPDDKHNADYYLCIGCIEKRLGRHLESQDFPMNLPINVKDKHSDRLQSRIDSNN